MAAEPSPLLTPEPLHDPDWEWYLFESSIIFLPEWLDVEVSSQSTAINQQSPQLAFSLTTTTPPSGL